MGVAASRILAEHLTTACSEASRDGKDRIDSVLSNPAVVKCLAVLYKALPPDSKYQICGQRQRNAAKRAAARPNSQLQTSPSATEALSAWKQDPNSFFSLSGGSKINFNDFPLARFYNFFGQVEKSQVENTIRARLIRVFFYRLHTRFHEPYRSTEALARLVHIIIQSGFDVGDVEHVQERLKASVAIGSRYHLIAKDLGGLGVLFLLPDDISANVWEKDLPKKECESRKKLITSLQSRGICIKASELGAHEVATKIMDLLWETVKSDIGPTISDGCDQNFNQPPPPPPPLAQPDLNTAQDNWGNWDQNFNQPPPPPPPLAQPDLNTAQDNWGNWDQNFNQPPPPPPLAQPNLNTAQDNWGNWDQNFNPPPPPPLAQPDLNTAQDNWGNWDQNFNQPPPPPLPPPRPPPPPLAQPGLNTAQGNWYGSNRNLSQPQLVSAV
ncbi:hypothetical protein BDFG_07739 [Blastomyces dermatitidis ATCC 26199]|nr:hypothetical protein BDFG_07739 [Blastomyces dermatitidis ATCC 26199]